MGLFDFLRENDVRRTQEDLGDIGPLDARVYCQPYDRQPSGGRNWFQVDPDVVYPRTIRYIRQLVSGELENPMCISLYMAPIRALPASAWSLAGLAKGETAPGDLKMRETALELVRLVFTAVLRDQVGESIGLRILKRERWRL